MSLKSATLFRILFIVVILAVLIPPAFAQSNTNRCTEPPHNPFIPRIESVYGYTFDDYSYWYCQGVALTGIAQSMELAIIDGDDSTDFTYYLNILISGVNYGEALAELGISLSDLAPGKLLFQ